jgi:hypothetical protein
MERGDNFTTSVMFRPAVHNQGGSRKGPDRRSMALSGTESLGVALPVKSEDKWWIIGEIFTDIKEWPDE